MTTYTYSSTVAHANDANFRAWGLDYSDALTAVGLLKTADTGQIDWATVARPGTNTAAGYEIRTFADALQSTAPVYIKFEYGTGASATRPQIWISIGSGSDGAGNLTGVYIDRRSTCDSNNLPGGTTPAYFCHTEGFAGIGWVPFTSGGNPKLINQIIIQRTTDEDGTPNAFGLDVINRANNSTASAIQVAARFANQALGNIGNPNEDYLNCINPYGLDSGYSYDEDNQGNPLPDTYYQVFSVYSILQPDYPLVGCVAVPNDLIFNVATQLGTQYQLTRQGFGIRNYINMGGGQNTQFAGAASQQQMLMLWE